MGSRVSGMFRRSNIAAFLFAGIFCTSAWAQNAGATRPAAEPAQPDRAAWMAKARFGVMTHYLSDWIARRGDVPGGRMSVDNWNDLVDHFDVEAFADQIKSTGAGYLFFTIGQNSGYFTAPNATYDSIVGISPSHCSKRDLVGDIATAMAKRGIRVIAYLPSGAPAGDRVADQKLQWKNGPYRNREFQENWNRVIADWSMRWGTKISGWWFDGCYWPDSMYRSEDAPNFKDFAAAARAGNPDAAIAFNPGVVNRSLSISPYEDFIAGEISNPNLISITRQVDGKVDGKQIHVLCYIGASWGTAPERFSADEVVGFSRVVWQTGGAITWDVPIQKGGTIAEPFIERLKAVGAAALQPVTRPSRAGSRRGRN